MLLQLRRSILCAGIVLALPVAGWSARESQNDTHRYLVRAATTEQAAQAVVEVGGTVTHRFEVLPAVGASLTAKQEATLSERPGIRVIRDRAVETQGADQASAVQVVFAITSDEGDAEESRSGRVYLESDDLDIGDWSTARVGLHFANVDLPEGAEILEAFIELVAEDEEDDSGTLEISAEASDDPAPFRSRSFDLTRRASTSTRVVWSPEEFDDEGERYRTADIGPVLREIVTRPGWHSGNGVTFFIEGNAERDAVPFDQDEDDAPTLIVTYVVPPPEMPDPPPADPGDQPEDPPPGNPGGNPPRPPAGEVYVVELLVVSGPDDAEEKVSGGHMNLDSTDLELSRESDEQLIGLRFRAVPIPAGAFVRSARLQFRVDETTSEPTDLRIRAEASDSASAFLPHKNNLSERQKTVSAVTWRPLPWLVEHAAQRTPDLAPIVNEVVSRPGWSAGNDLALLLDGSGKRVAESWDSGHGTPLLVIEYIGQPPAWSSQTLQQVCGADPNGWSDLEVIDADFDGASELELEVENGLPYGPLSLNDRFLGCLDDRGDRKIRLHDFFGDSCDLVVSDSVSVMQAVARDCVAWRDTYYPSHVGANTLHASGVTGRGVSIAVIDTGIADDGDWGGVSYDVIAFYDAITDREGSFGSAEDGSGHGSHVASIAAGLGVTRDGLYNSIAPGAELVAVKAFDKHGRGTYLDVIRAIDWSIQNKSRFGIRVLNMSFSATPQSYYWDDPLNQAVMAAWQAGLVVVASAGNTGPDPMTIGVPGNVPYVITVGAISDAYTPGDESDDFLTTFSAAGPTYERFVKPEVVAPGGHMLGLMDFQDRLPHEHPRFHDGPMGVPYFTMSGTSQSAAVVSGLAALMIQMDPTLTPDNVKCRMMASARPARTANGELAYSIFQQGAGLVDARTAIGSRAAGCANRGLNIDRDLADVEHYAGRAAQDELGNFYLEGLDGFLWNVSDVEGQGFLWNTGTAWSEGFLWNVGFVWEQGFLWNVNHAWETGFLWNVNLRDPAAINAWVPQE